MEKMTPSRVAEIRMKHGRPTKNEHVYQQLFALEIGEALHVKPYEWKIKTPPYWNVNPVAKMRKSPIRFSCKSLYNGKGWIITRIK